MLDEVARTLLRVPVVGGLAAWQLLLGMLMLGLGALGLGLPEMTVLVGVLGLVGQHLVRSVVVEISTRGLTRGLVLNGRFIGRTTVLPWEAIASIDTRWRRPGDDTALATTVRDSEGRTLRFTTAMGLRAYWTCVTSVAAHVPAARRCRLTEAVLTGEPPGRRPILAAAGTAGGLALILAALVGLHALWGQGRGSFQRLLDEDASGNSAITHSSTRGQRD